MAMRTEQQWFDAMRAKGHMPCVESTGYLDIFVCDEGFHNGPGCETCHWSICYHCYDLKDIPECKNPVLELQASDQCGGVDALK